MIDTATNEFAHTLEEAGSESFYDCHSSEGNVYRNDENCDAEFRLSGEFVGVQGVLEAVEESPDWTAWSVAVSFDEFVLSLNYYKSVDVSSVLYTEDISV